MHTKAIVNYHIASDERQAYYIDADGVKGKLVSPELVPTEVTLHDLRDKPMVSFWKDSLSYLQHSSNINDFENNTNWQAIYNEELTQLLMHEVGAKEVIIFDHTVRIDDPNAERKPARNVHSDYSPSGAHERLKDIVGTDRAKEWASGHYGFINIWRPVEKTITSSPLGFLHPNSVSFKDWITLDLIYPDRIGQIMGLIANDSHKWIYLSNMTTDEIALFNIYDNKGLASIGHSALDLIEQNNTPSIRKSIESRTLVRY